LAQGNCRLFCHWVGYRTERAGCALLWVFNPSTSWLAAASAVAAARARGAKLIVVDPRHIGLAVKADLWLPVRPGTDGAVALSIAGVMIEHAWFDADFVRDWTNGAFLVRDDDGTLLRADKLAGERDCGDGDFVAWDEIRETLLRYDTSSRTYSEPPARLALRGSFVIATQDGPITCRPAFEHFAALCRSYPPERAAAIAGVEADAIRQVAHLIWHNRPLAYFTWTGLEQHTNATHTARAHAILHALTGSIVCRAAMCILPRCQ
jgi:anaerobic selenocysteine-containing dehydrogenase